MAVEVCKILTCTRCGEIAGFARVEQLEEDSARLLKAHAGACDDELAREHFQAGTLFTSSARAAA